MHLFSVDCRGRLGPGALGADGETVLQGSARRGEANVQVHSLRFRFEATGPIPGVSRPKGPGMTKWVAQHYVHRGVFRRGSIQRGPGPGLLCLGSLGRSHSRQPVSWFLRLDRPREPARGFANAGRG